MSKELIERLRADAESTDDIGLRADAADRIEELERFIKEQDALLQELRPIIVAASELRKERDQLRAELAAALAACKMKDEAILNDNYSLALSIQPDTSALEAVVKKAGEVMREECITVAGPEDSYQDDWIRAKADACDAIRNLPAVTLEDLK